MTKTRILSAVTVSESVIFFYGLHAALSKAGFVSAICASDGPELRYVRDSEGATIFSVPMQREINLLSDFYSLMRVFFVVFKFGPHIVNAGTPKAGLLYMIAAWALRVPRRVYHVRGLRHESLEGFSRKLQIFIERTCGFLATDIICETKSLKMLALQEGLYNADKAVVLGPGSSGVQLRNFDSSLFSPSSTAALKVSVGIPDDAKVIGFLGRLIPRKGICELLDAWADLRELYTDLYLLLVGPFEREQALDPAYLMLIESDSRIISVGAVTSPAQFYTLMDVFALPAHWEGFGNVLVEAAAMGVPVVTTDGTGTIDAVGDNINGKVIKGKNALELKAALQAYLDDPALCELHGQNGIEWSKRFDRNIILKHLVDFYNGLI